MKTLKWTPKQQKPKEWHVVALLALDLLELSWSCWSFCIPSTTPSVCLLEWLVDRCIHWAATWKEGRKDKQTLNGLLMDASIGWTSNVQPLGRKEGRTNRH